MFSNSNLINTDSYNVQYLEDGSILLKPKNKAMKNNSDSAYRTDSSEEYKTDAQKAYDLYIYRMENAHRDSDDPLREFPPSYDSLPSEQKLDAAVKQYCENLENAWKY